MIDLHMHTCLSDGACTIDEVLQIANKLKLTYISITDHNHALAYEGENLLKLRAFEGKVIPGCEIATSYGGFIIEILGYGIIPQKINSWYRNVYSDENLIKNETWLFNKLKKLCIEEKLKLEDNLELGKIEKGCSKKVIYESLIKFKENVDTLNLKSYHDFFRLMLSNPEHPLFLNEAETYPSLENVVDLIHNANGKAFLAHPFEYGFCDTLETVKKVIKLVPIDGIECFHPSAAISNSKELVDFCKLYSLYTSGGSDFHNFKRKTRVGLSSGNEPICDEVILPWIKEEYYA